MSRGYKMGEINWKDKCWMNAIYLVRDDGKVLLHWNKNMQTWIPIAGHIEHGETPEEATRREVKEETGFDFDFLEAPEYSGNSKIIKMHRFQIDDVPHHNKHMTFIFMGKCKNWHEKATTDENEKLKWFSEQEIENIKDNMIESVWKVALDSIKLVNKKAKEKIGTGIGIMVLKNGKVLLGKRHEDPEKASSELKGAGTWTMPGGKLHFGESFEQGAIREVIEETGIRLKDMKLIAINNDQVEGAHFITTGLLAETDQEPQVLEPDEITEWRWFPLDNLPSPIYFPSAKLLENYKNKQFYIKE
jgi:8-oxo-dGTP diphosphatase